MRTLIGAALFLLCSACPQLLDDGFRTQSAVQAGRDASAPAMGWPAMELPAIDLPAKEQQETDGGAAPLAASDAATSAADPADAGSGVDASREATGNSSDASAVPAHSCRSGSHATANGACYALFDTQLSWPAARAECRARGSGWDLASIHSSSDSELLLPLISSALWVGGSDQALEGTWLWADDGSVFWRGGSAVDGLYANWNSGEPNGNDPSDCLRILPGATWADFQCENALGYICGGPAD